MNSAQKHPVHPRRSSGFTLLELSVVLIIIALITGMAITSGIAVTSTARLSATNKKIKALDEALLAFRNANDRLPCPADITIAQNATNFGVEAANSGCTGGSPAANFTYAGTNVVTGLYATAAEGGVPVITLGVPADLMVDGWGNRFRYAVDIKMTHTGMFSQMPSGCVNGSITINDVNGNTRSAAAAYAIISHGANGNGAYTKTGALYGNLPTNTNEKTNCHYASGACNGTYGATYVQASASLDPSNTSNEFDDIVSFKERWQMLLPADKTGSICPYIYVSDTGNNRVVEFNLDASFAGSFSATNPYGLVVDSSGYVWVVNTAGQLSVYKNGVWVKNVGSAGDTSGGQGIGGACFFDNPTFMAINSHGNLLIDDDNNNRVEECNPTTGKIVNTIIIPDGCCARGLAIDPGTGNLWVPLFNQGSMFIFDQGGNLVHKVGGVGQPDQADLYQVAFNGNNVPWVLDTGNGVIFTYSNPGYTRTNWLTPPAQTGITNGTMETGLAFDPSGNMWITDSATNLVSEINWDGTTLNFIQKLDGSTIIPSPHSFSGPTNIYISGR